MLDTLPTYLMLTMIGISLLTDQRTGKIYNCVTVPGAVLGLTFGVITNGLAGGLDRLFSMAVVLFIMVILSPIAKIGGGDIKLLMAVGALQGMHFTLWMLLLTGIAGGVLALGMLVRRRAMKRTFQNMMANAISKVAGVSAELATGSSEGKMKYSLAIAMGAAATLVIQA